VVLSSCALKLNDDEEIDDGEIEIPSKIL